MLDTIRELLIRLINLPPSLKLTLFLLPNNVKEAFRGDFSYMNEKHGSWVVDLLLIMSSGLGSDY